MGKLGNDLWLWKKVILPSVICIHHKTPGLRTLIMQGEASERGKISLKKTKGGGKEI